MFYIYHVFLQTVIYIRWYADYQAPITIKASYFYNLLLIVKIMTKEQAKKVIGST